MISLPRDNPCQHVCKLSINRELFITEKCPLKIQTTTQHLCIVCVCVCFYIYPIEDTLRCDKNNVVNIICVAF